MLTLIGSLLGFFTSFVPELLSCFREGRDQKHELELMDRQVEYAKIIGQQKMDMIEVQADSRETEALYQHAAAPSGNWFIESLRGSVRPVITYLFMLMFMAVETCIVIAAMRGGINLADAILIAWDEPTHALFATILSFWFGGRQYRRILGARSAG